MNAVPEALANEQAVLFACISSEQAFKEAGSLLPNEPLWYRDAHYDIWKMLASLVERFGGYDPVTLAAELNRAGKNPAVSALIGLTSAPITGSMDYHCQTIIRAYAARELLKAAIRAQQKVESGHEPLELAEDTIEQLRKVQRVGDVDLASEIDFLDIVARVVDPAKFVVPGLLARDNRIVITAPEGYGKSSLLRMIAACCAGGQHPFKLNATCMPRTSMVIDAENPADINTVEYQKIYDCLDRLDRLPDRGALVIEECGPINVLDPRVAAKLCAQVERVQPELIVIGPLYQLHDEDANDERAARKLAAFLDRLRRISRSALVTEAHTPHSDGPQGQILRPFGASLWKRWPEFGYCLHPAVKPKNPDNPTDDERASISCRESKFTPWRGARAARDWPQKLRMGHRMLWEVIP